MRPAAPATPAVPPTAPVSRIFPGMLLLVAACGGDPVEPEPNTITISPASVTLESLGDTVRLTAGVEDRDGRPMPGVTVTWASADESVATVDTGGLVTATGNGVATVKAYVEGVAGSSEITVAQRVASVLVSPREWTLQAFGATILLEAGAADANGHVIEDLEFTWSSEDESVVTVDGTGLVTAVGNGEAVVAASVEDRVGGSRGRVAQRAVDMQVSPEEAILAARGDTIRLVAEATDANGHVIEHARFTWSSDRPAWVEVDTTGLVTAVGNGVVPVYAALGVRLRAGALVTVELDRGVLLRLYETMGGADWDRNENWGTDAPLDTWYGVRGSGLVTVLALSRNGLTGSIPLETADLRFLSLMALDGNSITGPIPAALGNLPRLSVIVVSDNRLSGPIPSELGNLESLMQLAVANNRLTGPIPSELGNLARLVELDVSHNQLIGPVPPEIGDLGQLKVLRVNDTLMSGQLPLELIGLPLRVFTWDGTDLCAPDDEEFQEWLESIPTTSGPDC
ncbi:MAG: Ig-like domain-containing protein [Gemmatimonadota bacterium]|nr:Ig-like domain-containing protein [Gemmatimonadota bacterium]